MERSLIIKKLFEEILPDIFKDNPDTKFEEPFSVQINISGASGGSWIFDAKEKPRITKGNAESPDCTVSIIDEDFFKLIRKSKMDWGMAYFDGKIKIKGGNPATAKALKTLEKYFDKAKEQILKSEEINP